MTENPPCPTCDGHQVLDRDDGRGGIDTFACPEPHCVNGRMDDDWCRAIAGIVMSDFRDGFNDTYDYLRAVRP